MSRLDHSRRNARDRIARNGADNIADHGLPGGLSPPRQRPSKAEQRQEATAALAAATRVLRCPCGHEASLPVTAKMRGKRFVCSKCNRRMEG